MQRSRLPTDVYVKKAADQGRCYFGIIVPSDASRLADGGLELSAPIEADVEFGRDGQGRFCSYIRVRAQGLMQCQRCLDTMHVELESANSVLIVDSWDDVPSTRSDDDVVVASDERLDLVEVVLDELLVQIPFAPRHPVKDGVCVVADGVAQIFSSVLHPKAVKTDAVGKAPEPDEVKSDGAIDQGELVQPFADLATLLAANKRK